MRHNIVRPLSAKGPGGVRIYLRNHDARAARGVNHIVVRQAGAQPSIIGFRQLHQNHVGAMSSRGVVGAESAVVAGDHVKLSRPGKRARISDHAIACKRNPGHPLRRKRVREDRTDHHCKRRQAALLRDQGFGQRARLGGRLSADHGIARTDDAGKIERVHLGIVSHRKLRPMSIEHCTSRDQ